jgi:GT2 family glycosyltransferase
LSNELSVVERRSGETGKQYCEVSVVIVSFNTRNVLRRCLRTLLDEISSIAAEVLVIDNGSKDGSAEMVADEFPDVRLTRADRNIGFAAANNILFAEARGRYIVLLNSDAFLQPGSLQRAIAHMEDDPKVGLGGARLIGEAGEWQPSARMFPSVLNDFLSLSGLAQRFRASRFAGRADRTWADPLQEAEVDWVPGAFSIIRTDALKKIGWLDDTFFLYYEEVDLCRRLKKAGYSVRYWPDIVVIHLGGESSKSVKGTVLSSAGTQLTLWRLRSGYLYYRKHHGSAAWRAMSMELNWHRLRILRNRFGGSSHRRDRVSESRMIASLVKRAWKETNGGRVCPPRPW